MFVNYNGILFSADEPVLTTANRSFLYGDGLFESMRMVNRKVIFLDRHLERLKNGMDALNINYSNQFNTSFISGQISTLAKKNGIESNARVRLNIFRKEGGFYAPEDDNAEYFISIVKVNENDYQLNSAGLNIDVYEDIKKPVNKLSSFKTCNALIYVLAGVWKNNNNLDEVLILNESNRVCEGMNANVFVVKDNKITTIPVAEGCIRGVMRDQVIKIIKQKNILFSEENIGISDLNTADEIFLTNASLGVRWIGAFRNRRYFCKVSKEIVKSLNELIKYEF